MTAPAGTTTATPATVAAVSTAPETGTEATAPETTTATAVKLSPEQQAHVDGVIARRLREEKQRMDGDVERRVQEQIAREKMDAQQRAEAERDEARKAAEEAASGSKRAVAEARVETALLAAGIKPARIDAVARLVNLDDVAGSDDQKAAAAAAVTKVLADFPEFRPTPGASGGELGGGAGKGAVTLEQFKGMDYDARVELFQSNRTLYDQLTAQIQGA